jgi:hypothetical protein
VLRVRGSSTRTGHSTSSNKLRWKTKTPCFAHEALEGSIGVVVFTAAELITLIVGMSTGMIMVAASTAAARCARYRSSQEACKHQKVF